MRIGTARVLSELRHILVGNRQHIHFQENHFQAIGCDAPIALRRMVKHRILCHSSWKGPISDKIKELYIHTVAVECDAQGMCNSDTAERQHSAIVSTEHRRHPGDAPIDNKLKYIAAATRKRCCSAAVLPDVHIVTNA
jgi:hypothetical protein